jgi:DNA-binding response OmpR family regulator
MRVLICDQESEMLESIARTFEVDIATSKATCIDLMRANPFDALVASERLSDGSGLELLSHVATRWPETLRVLVIEPARLKLLRGKLGPFRLDATLNYPIDENELETVLNRLYGRLAQPEELAPAPASTPPPPPTVKAEKLPPRQDATRRSSPVTVAGKIATSNARNAVPLGTPRVETTPVKRRLGNYTPLGSPDEQMRIVEREFDRSAAPLAARAMRAREEATRPRSSAEKAKVLAAHLSNTLRRILKR